MSTKKSFKPIECYKVTIYGSTLGVYETLEAAQIGIEEHIKNFRKSLKIPRNLKGDERKYWKDDVDNRVNTIICGSHISKIYILKPQ